jgi:organic radical activating enzyme
MNTNLQEKNIVEIINESVTIDWHLGNHCQYSCSYCPSKLHAGDSKKLDLENMKRMVLLAEENLKFPSRSKKIYFVFAGGEPTLNKNFGPLIKWLKKRNHNIGIVTNGGRSLRWWEEWGDYLNGVVFSYHTEFTDLDHFYNIIKIQSEKQCRVDVHLIAWPTNFDKIKQAHAKLLTLPKNFTIVVKRINKEWIDNPNVIIEDYTVEQNNWINENVIYKSQQKYQKEKIFFIREKNSTKKIPEHPLVFNNWKLNNFKGWECNLGITNLAIDIYGNIYGAHCKQIKLGSLDDLANLVWPENKSVCTSNKCSCATDVMISKSKLL